MLLVEEQGLLEALVHYREGVFRQQLFRPNEVRPSRTHIESVRMRIAPALDTQGSGDGVEQRARDQRSPGPERRRQLVFQQVLTSGSAAR
jgi:hypothetical protein